MASSGSEEVVWPEPFERERRRFITARKRGEGHIALAVAGRAFGEGEVAREFLERGAGSDDLAVRRQDVHGAKDTQKEWDEVFHIGLTALIERQL